MQKEVRLKPDVVFARKEDMAPKGYLALFMQKNGDMVIQIEGDDSMGTGAFASVGFTMPMIGGGASPRTFEALKQLAIAIALDNAEAPGRKGDGDASAQCVTAAVQRYPAALRKHDIVNFETLKYAGQMGDLALVSAVRKSDNKPVALVTAIGFNNGAYTLTPLAVMVEGNPYEDFIPPEGEKEETKPTRRKKK